MLNFSQLLPCRFILRALVLSTCLAGPVSAQITLPNQAYVLPTTVTVGIHSGKFLNEDFGFGDESDVYGIVSFAGNSDQHTPIIEDDQWPEWDPVFTTSLIFDIATYGYSSPLKLEFWDDDEGITGDDDFLEDKTIDFYIDGTAFLPELRGTPIDYKGLASYEYNGVTLYHPTYITASVEIDGLRVQLDNGESWNTGSNQLWLGKEAYREFEQVTINSGGTLTAPGGVFLDNQSLITINSGGLLTSSGTVWILGSSTLDLNFGGTLQVGALATDPDALIWRSGTLEFLNGLSVSNTNPFNLADPEIRVGRTLKVNGELEIVSGGALIVSHGILDTRDNVVIDGGYLSANPSESGHLGRFDVAPGKTVTFRNNGVGVFDGNHEYSSGKTLEVLSGGDVKFGRRLALDDATLLVDGATSELTTNNTVAGTQFWGTAGGTTNATFRNGAQGFLKSGLALGTSGTAGTVGNLNVESDADVTLNGHTFVGAGTAGTGTLTVTGAGSTLALDFDYQLTVGEAGASVGMVHINDSGILRTGTSTTFIKPTGTIAIDGGTLHARGHMSIDGGALTLTSGSFDVNAGKFVTFTNNGQGNFSVPQDFSSGQILEVFSGSDVMFNGSLNLGVTGGGDGTIVVDGAGSTLTVGSPMSWGKNSGTANATFRNGAQGNLNDQLSMAFTGVSGTVANLNVESNAMVTARSIILASHTQGTATMTIAGSGSTLMQTGASTLSVGGTGASMGTININGGGTLQSGTGTITINPTGNVNLAAGTFNARGILEIRGGTFEMNHPDSRTFADSINFYSGVFNLDDGLFSVTNFGGSLVNNGGTLSPGQLGGGQLAGTTAMTGDYTVNAGSLEINLGGLVAGNEHDYLDIFGNVTLGGTLDVSLIDAFTLSPGQAFEIVDVGGLLSGTFSGLGEGDVVGSFGGTDLLISYMGDDGNDVVLFTETGVTADFDNDFDVDGADFLKWQRGQSPNPLSSSDLTDWQQNYGNPNSVAASSATVPEPTTGVTALSGLMSLLFRRRRLSYGPSVLGNRSVNSL